MIVDYGLGSICESLGRIWKNFIFDHTFMEASAYRIYDSHLAPQSVKNVGWKKVNLFTILTKVFKQHKINH
jgi:hypothetical protein